MAKKKPTKKPASKPKATAKKKTEMVKCELCSEKFDAVKHHRVCCDECAKLLCPECRMDCGSCGLTFCEPHSIADGGHDCPEDVEEEPEIIEEEEEDEDDDEEMEEDEEDDESEG